MKVSEFRADEMHRSLTKLVGLIDSTGGVLELRDGLYAPNADPDWIDLADLYMEVCSLLGLPPRIREDFEEEEAA